MDQARTLWCLLPWFLSLACSLGPERSEVNPGPQSKVAVSPEEPAVDSPRQDIVLEDGWESRLEGQYEGIEERVDWKPVHLPHNWDDYYGYRNVKHGNLHGTAWYRRQLNVDRDDLKTGRRVFLWFEGVGSYATVWVNGNEVGRHAGGRTSFTLDITDALQGEGQDRLEVKAHHPPDINDLPWICGGGKGKGNKSEGSQPLGIFRPVHLVRTHDLRIEPFGVHIWNDKDLFEGDRVRAKLHVNTEIRKYGKQLEASESSKWVVKNRLLDHLGNVVAETAKDFAPEVLGNEVYKLSQDFPVIQHPHLWSLDNPYLYTLVSEIWSKDQPKLLDRVETPYGIRSIHWPIEEGDSGKQFLLNGQAEWIHGTGEYEHQIGGSHAFTAEQIKARADLVEALGFNAFRDAHHPHNLAYQKYWDEKGILWWTQLTSNLYMDNDAFRENFKNSLREWVRERRNSPSLILWGLENESQLPEKFAQECVQIIRELDPTTSSQRKVTTCNGGVGTDWNVPQNWTGTYGGDPNTYAEDLRTQRLVGEYGAWRSIEAHAEGGYKYEAPYTEERISALFETKLELARQAQKWSFGHFLWILYSHDNPGRAGYISSEEGFRHLDRIGPVNYKGLLTSWGEPLDVFYLYRSNFVDASTDPVVHIVSHTWPSRWKKPGIKKDIQVFSNCDEVELFNDVGRSSLGIQKRKDGISHFQWDDVPIEYNLLYAEGRVDGKVVARDWVKLNHLPEAPSLSAFLETQASESRAVSIEGHPGQEYLLRVNLGGPAFTDTFGQSWLADATDDDPSTWSSHSWDDGFDDLPSYFASQRRIFEPVLGTANSELFQSFRFGRQRLYFDFPVPEGEYELELYFTEPWCKGSYCEGQRVFDVAVNGARVLDDLDLWKEAGYQRAIKKVVPVKAKDGRIRISFPETRVGQALLSGLAISRKPSNLPAPEIRKPNSMVQLESGGDVRLESWLDVGRPLLMNDSGDSSVCTIARLPPSWYGDEWIQLGKKGTRVPAFTLRKSGYVYLVFEPSNLRPKGTSKFEAVDEILEDCESEYSLVRRYFKAGEMINLGKITNLAMVVIHRPDLFDRPFDQNEAPEVYSAKDAKWMRKKGTREAETCGAKCRFHFLPRLHIAGHYRFRLFLRHEGSVKHTGGERPEVQGNIRFLDPSGELLHQQDLATVFGQDGTFFLEGNTGDTFNAGRYKLDVELQNANGWQIDRLEVLR